MEKRPKKLKAESCQDPAFSFPIFQKFFKWMVNKFYMDG